jgi:leader peptidase (prepilin peptidase) / N-methyltransferase
MEELPVIGLVMLGLLGLAVGSFLNVVVVRVPEGGSIVSPPSHCTTCGAPIKPYDNIPVVSWFVLRGRCRSCGEQFGFAYVLVELGNAVLWVAAGLRFGMSWALIPMLVLFSTLLVQSVIDLETYRLPDKINFPVLGALVVLVALVSLGEGEPRHLALALAGSVAYSLGLFLPAMVMPGGMGLGDVKLALLMGLGLGWIHPVLVLFSLIIACGIGIVVGLGFLVVRGKSAEYPFGPWLALGCIIAIIWSQPLLDIYLIGTADFLAGP